MKEEWMKKYHGHRHYTAEEVFRPARNTVRGFTEKNYSIGMHSQEFYEINIVLRGDAEHYIDQRRIAVSAGDTFIIPPNVMHGYDGGDGFDVYHILLHPKYLERNFADLCLLPAFSSLFIMDPMIRGRTETKPHFRLSEAEIERLMPHLESLSLHSYEMESFDFIISGSEAMIVIALLCDIYRRHASSPAFSEEEDAPFFASLSHLHENYSQKLTVDGLAQMSQMSRNSYIAKFKRITGEPPARFLRRYRAEIAERMLAQGRMTEAEIAAAVGFTDASHLARVILRETGKTPSRIRREKNR